LGYLNQEEQVASMGKKKNVSLLSANLQRPLGRAWKNDNIKKP
jgi:hypothetical protein